MGDWTSEYSRLGKSTKRRRNASSRLIAESGERECGIRKFGLNIHQ
jgi:hypothetical protein